MIPETLIVIIEPRPLHILKELVSKVERRDIPAAEHDVRLLIDDSIS
jgi:hypothetical protein